MSLAVRVLPVSEWHRIATPETAAALPLLNPAKAQILVVEDDGQIVGHWIALQTLHAEGVWIAPDYRKAGGVARKLWRAMRQQAVDGGYGWLMTGAQTADVRALIVDHLGGQPLSVEQFVVSVKG